MELIATEANSVVNIYYSLVYRFFALRDRTYGAPAHSTRVFLILEPLGYCCASVSQGKQSPYVMLYLHVIQLNHAISMNTPIMIMLGAPLNSPLINYLFKVIAMYQYKSAVSSIPLILYIYIYIFFFQ